VYFDNGYTVLTDAETARKAVDYAITVRGDGWEWVDVKCVKTDVAHDKELYGKL
jgi:hypothetical protein